MNEYSFMKGGTLTRRVVNLFQSGGDGFGLSIEGIARQLEFKGPRREAWGSEVEFTLEEVKVAVTNLFERKALGMPFAVKGIYAINNNDLWRTDKQYQEYQEYQEYQRWVKANSFMREGTLTKRVVDLFQPKCEGVTLTPRGIAKALRIKKGKSRKDFLLGSPKFTLKGLRRAIGVLSKGRNVLYKRTGLYASKAYAINNESLWRNDKNKQYISWGKK